MQQLLEKESVITKKASTSFDAEASFVKTAATYIPPSP